MLDYQLIEKRIKEIFRKIIKKYSLRKKTAQYRSTFVLLIVDDNISSLNKEMHLQESQGDIITKHQPEQVRSLPPPRIEKRRKTTMRVFDNSIVLHQ